MAKLRTLTVGFFLTVGIIFSLPHPANAGACDAFVSKWAWFIGGEVTVSPDGTFTQQSGNAGTWECTDPAHGGITMRWRDGGFVNSLVVSPDGQGLSSTDPSQSYVTARRTGPVARPQLIGTGNSCQEESGREMDNIDAEFEQKLAKCHYPGNAACLSEAVSTKASQLKALGEKLRLCQDSAGTDAPAPGAGPGDLASVPASNDEFHSSDGAECCPTQECQTQRYHALEFLRQQSAKRCVENKTSPCKVEPELIIPPLCEIPKDGDQIGGVGDNFGSSDCPPDYVNNDIPGASWEMHYQLGFSQAVRRCLTDQVTISECRDSRRGFKIRAYRKAAHGRGDAGRYRRRAPSAWSLPGSGPLSEGRERKARTSAIGD